MPLSCSCDTMTSPAAPFPAGHAHGRSSRPNRRLLSMHRRQPTSWAVVFAVFVCFVSHALAAAPSAASPVETLVIDHRTPHREGQRWVMLSEQEVQRRGVQKRQDESDEPESTESSKPTKTSESGSVTTTFSIAVGKPKSTSSSTSVSASPLPSIFDSMPADFSRGPDGGSPPCPKFIDSFLNDPEFKACYPLSMLIDQSKSFFEAQRSLVGMTRTLDATCAANPTSCNAYMKQLAVDFIAPENCGADYALQHPVVVDAHVAIMAYAPVYSAGCLKDPDTGAYCYASAVTNHTNPSSTFFYFLPLNKTLPGNTVPGCGYCLEQTMALYQAATADRTQPIAATYPKAAEQVNAICGPDFANETLAAAIMPSGVERGVVVSRWLATALPLLVGVWWVL